MTPESASTKDRRTIRNGVEMQHRHFSFIADVLKNTKQRAYCHSEWLKMVEAFADACSRSNRRFDRERFYKACGQ